MPAIAADGTIHGVHLLSTDTAVALRQVADYNASETLRVIRRLPGFVSASFLLSFNGRDLAEIVQWQSWQHFSRAFEDADFVEHLHVAHGLARPEPGFYETHRLWRGTAVDLQPDPFAIFLVSVITAPQDQRSRALGLLEAALDSLDEQPAGGLESAAVLLPVRSSDLGATIAGAAGVGRSGTSPAPPPPSDRIALVARCKTLDASGLPLPEATQIGPLRQVLDDVANFAAIRSERYDLRHCIAAG